MADQSDILSDEFESILSSEGNAYSGLLSADANPGSISTGPILIGRTKDSSTKLSSIH
jgi:hypothetical protein